MPLFNKAEKLLEDFKKGSYIYGPGVLNRIGESTSNLCKNAVLFRGTFPGSDSYVGQIGYSLRDAGVYLAGEFKGARPNSPREDIIRIAEVISSLQPGVVISFGGGSTIDAVKAAIVLATVGGSIDDYLGMGLVSVKTGSGNKRLLPHVACQTLASSAAHLTKYANITDFKTSQKKIIIDDAIMPEAAIFDYSITYGVSFNPTTDGAFDGLSHLIEVLYSAEDSPYFDLAYEIAETGIELIVHYLPKAIKNPEDATVRDALCLGTDLGGYAIMVGGTSGGHLNSFSLVGILSHGRACAIMNPYYSVFFAPAIEKSLKLICRIFSKYGYSGNAHGKLSGRNLGIYAAEAMIAFASSLGFPTRLDEIDGFNKSYIEKILKAAREPALSSKLQNMPIPMSADMINRYMGKVLESAAGGNLNIIENV